MKNDTKIETKKKLCTQTSQNGVTKKCSIYIAKNSLNEVKYYLIVDDYTHHYCNIVNV